MNIIDDGDVRQHLITSPGYPHGYEDNLDCAWSIYNVDRRALNISFKGSIDVCYDPVDIVTIDEGGDANPEYE